MLADGSTAYDVLSSPVLLRCPAADTAAESGALSNALTFSGLSPVAQCRTPSLRGFRGRSSATASPLAACSNTADVSNNLRRHTHAGAPSSCSVRHIASSRLQPGRSASRQKRRSAHQGTGSHTMDASWRAELRDLKFDHEADTSGAVRSTPCEGPAAHA